MENHAVKHLKMSFADLLGPDDEKKETCIHCGKTWYAIHYKDGVCHSCREKKLPGRTAIARKERRKAILIDLAVTAIVIFLAYLVML